MRDQTLSSTDVPGYNQAPHRPEVHPEETEGEEERAACPQLLPLGVIFYFFEDIERYRQGMV